MKKYLYSGGVSLVILSLVFLGSGTKIASAHGFVPHFLATGVTSVTSNSAVLTGTVDSMHSSWNGHAWFEYGTNPNSGNYQTSWGNKVGVRGIPWIGQTDMTTILTGLKPNTTYYFHLKAENKNGSNTGETMSFRTKGSNHIDIPYSNSDNNNNFSSSYIYNSTTNNTNITTTVNNNTNTWNYSYQNNYQSTGNQDASTAAVYTYHY